MARRDRRLYRHGWHIWSTVAGNVIPPEPVDQVPDDVEISGDERWATRYDENGHVLAVWVFHDRTDRGARA